VLFLFAFLLAVPVRRIRVEAHKNPSLQKALKALHRCSVEYTQHKYLTEHTSQTILKEYIKISTIRYSEEDCPKANGQ